MTRSARQLLAPVLRADRIWDILVGATATFVAVEIPLRLVLPVLETTGWGMLDWGITILFVVDIVVRYRRARKVDLASQSHLDVVVGFEPYSRAAIVTDLVAALPFHLLGPFNPLQILRLLKLFRVGALMSTWRRRTIQNSSKLRLAFLFFWLGVSAHWIACGWLALWESIPQLASPRDSYLRALYWGIETLTTVGYGDIVPQTPRETVYTICVMIFGISVYGFIIGNVASLLSNIDPARSKYLEQMETINAFMRYRAIPVHLQHRIRDYYAYLWDKRLGHDETAILESLPPGLSTEISLYLKRDIIEKVPIFQGASDLFIRDVALQMRPAVYMPGDFIFVAGEKGNEMYFINRGVAEAMSPEGEILSTMTDGDFFGEIALFLGYPRTASVKAITYCDLYRLDREMFDHVLENYPEIAEQMEMMARERYDRGSYVAPSRGGNGGGDKGGSVNSASAPPEENAPEV
jgi:voltage-gated potassium channel